LNYYSMQWSDDRSISEGTVLTEMINSHNLTNGSYCSYGFSYGYYFFYTKKPFAVCIMTA